MVEGCCSTQLRHYQTCLRLPPRVLFVCALCPLRQRIGLPRHRQALADQNILCAEGTPICIRSARAEHCGRPDLLGHPLQKARDVPYASSAGGHLRTKRWLWSTTQTRKWRMTTRTTTRRRAAPTARQSKSAGFQTRPPACLLYPSRSAIYTRLLCAPARKTIRRCTAVEKG